MELSPGHKFCVLPWIHRFINHTGAMQVCCTSEEYSSNIIANDGMSISIQHKRPDEAIRNSSYMKGVRKSLLNGQFPAFCKRCEMVEETGASSRRLVENSRYQDQIADFVLNTLPDGTFNSPPQFFDIRLGNICNLKCRMCSPHSSTQWLSSWNDIHVPYLDIPKEELAICKQISWFREKACFDYVLDNASTIDTLHFAGGEPFLVNEMWSLLDALTKAGESNHIGLTYNTNLTTLPKRARELWPHFKSTKLLVSIDGYGKLNEFIRYPSKWSDIENHLAILDSKFEDYNLIEIMISCTVQASNVLHLTPLYLFLATRFKRIVPIPHLVNLNFPEFYRTQILSPSEKEEARVSLLRIKDQLLPTIPAELRYLVDSIDSVIHFMMQEDRQYLRPPYDEVTQRNNQKNNQQHPFGRP